MKNVKNTAKKAVAILSSVTMIMSCGTAGMLTASAATSTATTASAAATSASTDATRMNIYDSNGNDISSNPIIYIDNSPRAGGKTNAVVKVKVGNDSGTCKDKIFCATEIAAQGQEKIRLQSVTTSDGGNTMTLNISAMSAPDEKGKQKSLKPGTTHLSFTTESGEVYRTLTVVVYEPATDMKIYFQNKNTQISLNDDNPTNSGGVIAVANHQYQFYANLMPTTSTDAVEWLVYDGALEGPDPNASFLKAKSTDKAEISPDGLFTPKKNGIVTVVAKCKATETSPRNFSLGDKKLSGVSLTDQQNLPKFIKVIIVKENPAKSLKITNAPGALEANDTYQLDLEKTPTYTGQGYESGATDEIRWVSSNPKVATVDSKGFVTAISKGDVTITAYGENANVYTSCDIRVLTKATAIKITPSPTSTRVGVGVQLTAKMSPNTADDEIVWTSSNPAIATVESTATGKFQNSQTAVVTGVKKGQVIITAKAKNSGVEAKCTVTVNDKIDSDTLKLTTTDNNVISTIAPNSTIDLYTNQDIVIDAALTAADGSAPDDTIAWQIIGNDDAYVTVSSKTSQYIKLHGVSAGTITVKAYSEAKPNTIYQKFKVQVLRSCDTVNLIDNTTEARCSSKSLNVGDSFALSADMVIAGNYPYDHSDSIKSWTSSNESVAKVNNSGVVTAVGNGSAVITAKTASGKKVSCSVKGFTTSQVIIGNVTASVDGISLPTASITLDKEGKGTKNLSVQVKNETGTNVSNVNTYWTSSDETVATVSNKGVITAKSVGQTTITVKSGTKQDSCILNVYAKISNGTASKISDIVYSPIVESYKPQIVVSSNGKTLTEGVDYTVEYLNNTKVGNATAKVTGIGNYTGTLSVPFKIVAKPLTSSDVSVSAIADQKYTGKAVTPEFTVTCEGVTLTKNVDYTVKFSNNSKVGTASVTITGKGNYAGTLRKEFTIYCNHDDTTVKVTKEATCTEDGKGTSTCKVCGNVATVVIPKKGHQFSKEWTIDVEATSTTPGSKSHHCIVCDEKKDVTVIPVTLTNISTISATSITLGSSIKLTAKATGGTAPYKYRYFCKPAGASDYTPLTGTVTDATYTHKPARAINYTYAVKIVDAKGNKDVKYFDVNVESTLANASTISATSINLGDSIKMTAKATGGTAPYKYRYFCKPEGSSKWTALTNTTTATTHSHKPVRTIKYEYMVKVADSAGKVIEKTFTVNVSNKNALVNNSTISATSINLGDSVKLTAKAVGGKAPYKYRYFCKPEGEANWIALTSTTTAATHSHKPTRAIKYEYMVKVADATGKVVEKTFTVDVSNKNALVNNSTISATSIKKGTTITLTAKAAGGKAPYKYRYFCKPEGDSNWTALTGTTTETTHSHKPARTIKYEYMVKVADSSGKVIEKTFTVNVS